MESRLGVRATLVLLVLISVLPVVLLATWRSLEDQKTAVRTAEMVLRVQSQQRAHSLAHHFEGVMHMLKVISHSPFLRNPRDAKCSRYLRELNAFFPQYLHLAFADPEGYLVCRSSTQPGTYYVGDREYFKGAVRSGGLNASEYVVSRLSGKPTIAVSLPLYRVDGRLHGVLYAALELTSFQDYANVLALPAGVTEFITDRAGAVLASNGQHTQAVGSPLTKSFLVQAIRARQTSACEAADGNGLQWLYAVYPANADGAGGLVVSSIISKETVLRDTVERLRKDLLVLLVITSAALLLAWQIGDRALAKPIAAITSKVNALEQGAAVASLTPALGGAMVRELGNIALGVDDMAQELQVRSEQRDRAMAEIVQQKQALEESERRYHAQFDASPQPMWVFDTETLAFLIVNDAAIVHYGYSREEFMKMSVLEIRPPEDIPQLMETLRQQEAQPANEVTLRHRRKNGEIITVEMSTHELSWDGRPARVVIAYDVSSREAARQAWQKLQETLEREVAQRTRELQLANEELESFSYSVSHDLRAPLAVVDGFCDAIVHRHGAALPEEARHYLDRIRVGARRMNALVDDLLTFSRTARAPIQSEQLDLTVLARGVVSQLRQRFPDRQVSVRIEEGLQAAGDQAMMTVLLTNLIGNAWKFTSNTPDAVIRVALEPSTGGENVIQVSDNGSGFDMAFADKLFKAFQRLHTEEEFEGTGIGLAIVNRIVQRHRGRIWAESAGPGQGATFSFSLPIVERASLSSSKTLPTTSEPDSLLTDSGGQLGAGYQA